MDPTSFHPSVQSSHSLSADGDELLQECLRRLLVAHRRVVRSIDWALAELEGKRALHQGAAFPGAMQWVTTEEFIRLLKGMGVMNHARLTQEEMHLVCRSLEDAAYGPGRVSLLRWRRYLLMEYFLDHHMYTPIGRVVSADPAQFWALDSGIHPTQLAALASVSPAEAEFFLIGLGRRPWPEVASALYVRRALLEGTLRAPLEQLFDIFDENNSSTIDSRELRSCLIAVGSPTNLDPRHLALWVRQLEMNPEGTTEVTKEEFVQLMAPVMLIELDWFSVGQANPLVGALENIFHDFDDDSTGSLDLGEFQRFIQKITKDAIVKLIRAEISLLFNDADINGDGEVDVGEFLDGFVEWLSGGKITDQDLNLALAKYKLRHTRPVRILEAAAAFRKLPSSCRLAPSLPLECILSRTLLAPLGSTRMDAASGLLSTDPMLAAAFLLERSKVEMPRASEFNLDKSELPPEGGPGPPRRWSAFFSSVVEKKVATSRWSPLRLRRDMARAVLHGTEAHKLRRSLASLTVSGVQGVEPSIPCEARRLRFTWYSKPLGIFVPGASSWEVDYVVDTRQPAMWRVEDQASFPLMLHLPRLPPSIDRSGLCLLVDVLVTVRAETEGPKTSTPMDVSVAWTLIPANEILGSTGGYSREVALHGGSVEWKEDVQGMNRTITGLRRLFTGPLAESKMTIKIGNKPSTEQLQCLCLLPDCGYVCPLYMAEMAQLYRLYCLLTTRTKSERDSYAAALLTESSAYTGSLEDPLVVVFPAIIDDSITRREFFASWRAELKEMPKDQCEDDMSLIRLLQALCLRFWLVKGCVTGGDDREKIRFHIETEGTVRAREAQRRSWHMGGTGQVRSIGGGRTVEGIRADQSAWLAREMQASGRLQQGFRPMHSSEFTDRGMMEGHDPLAKFALTLPC